MPSFPNLVQVIVESHKNSLTHVKPYLIALFFFPDSVKSLVTFQWIIFHASNDKSPLRSRYAPATRPLFFPDTLLITYVTL